MLPFLYFCLDNVETIGFSPRIFCQDESLPRTNAAKTPANRSVFYLRQAL